MPQKVKRSAKKPAASSRKAKAKPKAKKKVKAAAGRKPKTAAKPKRTLKAKASAGVEPKPQGGFLSKVKSIFGGAPEGQKPASKKLEAQEVGVVVGYFRVPKAGIIKVTKGSLKLGDMIWISGHTTDLRLGIRSMEIDRQQIQTAKKGQEIGIQVGAKVRRNDRVFKISSP